MWLGEICQHAEKIEDVDNGKELIRDSLLELGIITFTSDDSKFGNDEDNKDDIERLLKIVILLFIFTCV